MKKFITSVLCLMFAVAFMAVVPSVKAAEKPKPEMCIMTLAFLIDANKDIIVKIHTVEGTRFNQYMEKVNFLRAQKKLFPLEAVGMVIAEFKNGKIGSVLVDKNTCVVPGTISSGSMAEMKKVYEEIGFADLFDVVGGEV